MNNQIIDRIMGGLIACLGGVTLYGAWGMPRFENLNASPWEFVGLTPMVIGGALTVCGILLATRTKTSVNPQQGKLSVSEQDKSEQGYLNDIFAHKIQLKRFLWAMFITLLYGGGLFGNVHFIPATIVFIFVFFMLFTWFMPPETLYNITLWGTVIRATMLSVGGSLSLYFLFETIFLVQLP